MKVAVLTVEDTRDEYSPVMDVIECFALGDDLNGRVRAFLISYLSKYVDSIRQECLAEFNDHDFSKSGGLILNTWLYAELNIKELM